MKEHWIDDLYCDGEPPEVPAEQALPNTPKHIRERIEEYREAAVDGREIGYRKVGE